MLNVTLSQDILDFLDRLVQAGKYADREDAIRSLLDEIRRGMANSQPVSGGGDPGGDVLIQMRIPDVF